MNFSNCSLIIISFPVKNKITKEYYSPDKKFLFNHKEHTIKKVFGNNYYLIDVNDQIINKPIAFNIYYLVKQKSCIWNRGKYQAISHTNDAIISSIIQIDNDNKIYNINLFDKLKNIYPSLMTSIYQFNQKMPIGFRLENGQFYIQYNNEHTFENEYKYLDKIVRDYKTIQCNINFDWQKTLDDIYSKSHYEFVLWQFAERDMLKCNRIYVEVIVDYLVDSRILNLNYDSRMHILWGILLPINLPNNSKIDFYYDDKLLFTQVLDKNKKIVYFDKIPIYLFLSRRTKFNIHFNFDLDKIYIIGGKFINSIFKDIENYIPDNKKIKYKDNKLILHC